MPSRSGIKPTKSKEIEDEDEDEAGVDLLTLCTVVVGVGGFSREACRSRRR